MHTDYGKAFRVVRAVYGWRQADMARKLDISASQLSLIEAGKRQPSLRVIEKLGFAARVPSALVLLLASNERDIGDQDVSAMATSLLKLLIAAGDKQRVLPLEG